MLKHNHFAVVFMILACLIVPYPSGGNSTAEAAVASSDYADLVKLFNEFREFQRPKVTNGVPDYTAAAMEEQRRGLKEFQARLAAIDIEAWPVSQRVDYHLVRAEMNGLEFYHRVLRPWSRDPVFYLMSQGGAGPAMEGFRGLWRLDLPLSAEGQSELRTLLRAVPLLYEQAKGNLIEAAADLATIAIWATDREAGIYRRIATGLAEHHPDLVPDADRAAEAVRNYGKWVKENKSKMTAPAGIGKENYDWWLKNVHLSPYGWEESRLIVEQEYNRIVTFLKLEEHRNRKLPPLEVADTAEEYYRRLDRALNFVLEFLRDEEILTVPDWLHAADYSDPNEPRRPLPTDTSIDHKAREREILPGETHEFIGHLFDERRRERDERPIRGASRRFNMEWMRMEGWAVALEELLMQAGVLDTQPQKGREVEYLMNASHMSLALPDLKMHANEMTLDEARQFCADLMPRGWSQKDERMVWYEMQSNLRFPGFHTGVVVGKAYFMKIFRERAMQLGDDFNLKEFIDEFLAAGIIPMSLTRWEMTGLDDEIKELLE